MMNAAKTMFDTPNRGNQSLNINQLFSGVGDIAYQVNDPLLAGKEVSLIYAFNNTVTLTCGITGNQLAKIYANQSGEYFSGYKSGDILRYSNLICSKRGRLTPLAKGGFSHLFKEGDNPHWLESSEFCQSIKKENISKYTRDRLHLSSKVRYSVWALAKSSVRIETLYVCKAIHDAPSVFFCIVYNAYLRAIYAYTESMVALLGQLNRWLDSSNSSTSTPDNVTTLLERGSSCGDSLTQLLEIIIMITTLSQTHPKFIWRFVAIQQNRVCIFITVATSEQEARALLPHQPMTFTARIRQEVTA